MRLVALKPIPGSVQIPAGSTFNELDPDQALAWINSGHARLPDEPIAQGWRGLYWSGATVAILASGPSLTAQQCDAVHTWRDAARERRKVICINTTFRLAPWADLFYACDGEYFRAMEDGLRHIDEVMRHFQCVNIWTQDRKAATDFGLRYIESRREPGLQRNPDAINQGNNSGFQCINIAYHAGARRMILLGFDCKPGHWHKPHPSPLSNSLPLDRWKKEFRALAADCASLGIDVVNCSPDTALKAFRTAPLDEVLAE